jgi:hypothetical protein
MSTVLLFPGGMPECLSQLGVYTARGKKVIGASSITNDPARTLYPSWELIPFVTDPAFESTLLSMLETHAVDTVFTRHPIIGRYLEQIIEKYDLSITLDALGFASDAIEQQRLILARVDSTIASPFALTLPGQALALNRMQMASMMLHTLRIEGQSSDEKIIALMEIFRSCPKGDVVEIGSFWGRSACLLALLAKHYSIGSLLCLDPWLNDAAHQDGVSDNVNAEARAIDFDSAYRGFQLNLMGYSDHHVNFIRGDAHSALAQYESGLAVTTESFGHTIYTGKIACLHIDGNHDFAHVTQDIEDWVPRVIPGGWIIIDDYQWAFGDGPQIAADKWCIENQHRIACIFATGSALFIKLAE